MISKQFKRSQYITLNWTNRLGDRDPSSLGWIDGNNDAAGDPNWVIDIQDTSDQFYSLPLDIIKGCSCRKKCTSCNCKKNAHLATAKSWKWGGKSVQLCHVVFVNVMIVQRPKTNLPRHPVLIFRPQRVKTSHSQWLIINETFWIAPMLNCNKKTANKTIQILNDLVII